MLDLRAMVIVDCKTHADRQQLGVVEYSTPVTEMEWGFKAELGLPDQGVRTNTLNINWPWGITYGSILGWMSIHLPPILMFTRGTRGFDPQPNMDHFSYWERLLELLQSESCRA